MTWRLTSNDPDPRLVAFRLERVHQRNGAKSAAPSGEISIRGSPDTGEWSKHTGTAPEPPSRRLVLDILLANGPLSANALQRRAKRRRSDVLAAVRALEQEGLVRRNPDDRLEARA